MNNTVLLASEILTNNIKNTFQENTDKTLATHWDENSGVMLRFIYIASTKTFVMGPEPSFDPEYVYTKRMPEGTHIVKFVIDSFISQEDFINKAREIAKRWETFVSIAIHHNSKKVRNDLVLDVIDDLIDCGLKPDYEIHRDLESHVEGVSFSYVLTSDGVSLLIKEKSVAKGIPEKETEKYLMRIGNNFMMRLTSVATNIARVIESNVRVERKRFENRGE